MVESRKLGVLHNSRSDLHRWFYVSVAIVVPHFRLPCFLSVDHYFLVLREGCTFAGSLITTVFLGIFGYFGGMMKFDNLGL